MARCKNTDMLMGAIRKAGGGKVQTSADTARKLAGEMGGMKKGGKPKGKPAMAVMIAIGKPEKKKKGGRPMMNENISSRPTGPDGRPLTMADLEKSNRDVGGMNAAQVKAAGEAIGRGNRSPKDKMPIKRAQGGAAKVRKGMMSPSGQILQAVKPKKK